MESVILDIFFILLFDDMDSVRREIYVRKAWGSPVKKLGEPQSSNLYKNAWERKTPNAGDPKITRRRRKGRAPCHARVSLCLFVKRQKKQKVPEEMILQTLWKRETVIPWRYSDTCTITIARKTAGCKFQLDRNLIDNCRIIDYNKVTKK